MLKRSAHRALERIARLHQSAPPALIALLAGLVALNLANWLANISLAPGQTGGALALGLAAGRLGALVVAFALVGLALLREPPAALRRIAPFLFWPLLLWAGWTAAQSIIVILREWPVTLLSPRQYGSDAVFDAHYNAWLVLQGENPYVGQWLTGVANYFHVIALTPLARGIFANPRAIPTPHQLHLLYNQFASNPSHPPGEIDPRTTHSYPAGSFLLLVPVVWAGLPSVAAGFVIALAALWLALIVNAPGNWRWLALLGPLLMVNGLRQIGSGGDFEILALAPLLGAWLARERRWVSAGLLGLALAVKQTAWFAAPFYLVWVWRSSGWREALRRGGIAAGMFTLINLPWIILSPREWLASMALPISLPLLPDGIGVVGLSQLGGLPFAPTWAYSLAELAALIGLLALVWRMWARAPFLAVLLPLAPLLFAWRAPERYFTLLPLTAVVAFLLTRMDGWHRRRMGADANHPYVFDIRVD